MGINTNDPNYVQNMMDDPNVQNQVNGLLQNPQVIDQIASREHHPPTHPVLKPCHPGR